MTTVIDPTAERASATGAARLGALLVLVFALAVLFWQPSWLVPRGTGLNQTNEGRTTTETKETTDQPTQTTTKETIEVTSGENPSEKTVNETSTTTPSETIKTTTETVDAPPDTGIWSRAFATPGVATLFRLGIAVLAAFLVGAAIQRIWLGMYGLKVGPLEVPELPPVTAKEVQKATEVINQSPKVGPMLAEGPRGPQPFPQFISIEDERLQLLSIRIQMEEQLRKLAQAMGLEPELSLDKILRELTTLDVIDAPAARGLREFIILGDRVASGAQVTPEASSAVRDEGLHVIYALQELTRRAQTDDESGG